MKLASFVLVHKSSENIGYLGRLRLLLLDPDIIRLLSQIVSLDLKFFEVLTDGNDVELVNRLSSELLEVLVLSIIFARIGVIEPLVVRINFISFVFNVLGGHGFSLGVDILEV